MKMTPQQAIEIVKLIATFLIGLISALCIQACTVSLSVSKNNRNSHQSTEQTSSSSIDSTRIDFKY